MGQIQSPEESSAQEDETQGCITFESRKAADTYPNGLKGRMTTMQQFNLLKQIGNTGYYGLFLQNVKGFMVLYEFGNDFKRLLERVKQMQAEKNYTINDDGTKEDIDTVCEIDFEIPINFDYSIASYKKNLNNKIVEIDMRTRNMENGADYSEETRRAKLMEWTQPTHIYGDISELSEKRIEILNMIRVIEENLEMGQVSA